MIPTTICLVLAFKSFIVFLFSWESFFPATIRQVSRGSVGVFPLLICPGGFLCFSIANVSHHYRRVIISDENSPKLRNDFHFQIWDPGISNFSFSWSNNSSLPVIVLDFGLIKVLIPFDDDGDACNFWAVTFSSVERFYRLLLSQVYFINLFCLWYKRKQRDEPFISCGGSHCIARASRTQVMSFCLIYIVYSNENHRCSLCVYQDSLLLNILSSMFWWYWRHPPWQQWVNNQQRLPHKLRECLLESSNILISTKRQDLESSPTTFSSHFLKQVMPKAFWSFSSKRIANNKCVKEGHNRLFHLLAWQTSERIAWLLSTLSSKLFQFPIFAYNGCFVLVLYFVNLF